MEPGLIATTDPKTWIIISGFFLFFLSGLKVETIKKLFNYVYWVGLGYCLLIALLYASLVDAQKGMQIIILLHCFIIIPSLVFIVAKQKKGGIKYVRDSEENK